MTPSDRTVSRCLLCGFTEVRTDEVVDRGVVLLVECPRCEHRSTQNDPRGAQGLPRPAVQARAASSREVAPAA